MSEHGANEDDTRPAISTRGKLAAIVSRDAFPYWAILAIALVVRLIHHVYMSQNDPLYGVLYPGGDNHSFDRWALEISQTFWLGYDRIPFFHGPLYPYFLGMVYLRFGHSYDAAVRCQHVLGAMTVVLIFHLGRRVFGKSTGWVAGLAAAFCPLFLLFEGEILSDSLVLFVNLAMLCLLIEAGRKRTTGLWALAGATMGLAVLGRPNMLLFIPVAALWCWIVQRRTLRPARPLLVFLAATCLTIAPATLANYLVGGKWHLVTYSGPVNLYIGNAHDATGVFATPPSMKEIIRKEGKPDRDIDWSRHLAESIRQHPTSLPRNLWKKARLFWQSGENAHNVCFYLKRRFSPFLKIPLVFGVVAPLGLIGLVMALLQEKRRRTANGALLLAAYVAVYAASIILVFVLSRLRLPALAVLMIFASHVLVETVSRAIAAWRARRRPQACALAASLLIAWLALGLALQSRDTSLMIRWNDHYNLAGAYEAQGRFEEAVLEYDEAIRLAPTIAALRSARQQAAKGIGPKPP